MRLMILFVFTLLLVTCKSNPNQYWEELMQDNLEYKAIKIIFSNTKPDELEKENLGVILFYDCMFSRNRYHKTPVDFIAWFKYGHSSEHIIVNYLLFPWPNDSEISSTDLNFNLLRAFLLQIIRNKKIVHTEYVKQLIIPLPLGLKNDFLLNNMHFKSLEKYTLGEREFFYWGFKSNKIEIVRYTNSHIVFYDQILEEILGPITDAILEHAIPEQWKEEEYSKWKSDLNEYIQWVRANDK